MSRVLALVVVVAITGACTDSDDDPGASERTGALSAVCPSTVVVQTDWYPEAEHGGVYELVGDGYQMSQDPATVTGPMFDGETDTGIDIEIRAGGPAITAPTTTALFADPDIMFSFVNTDNAALAQGEIGEMVAVVAPLEISPQVLIWDPATYPDIASIADLGRAGVEILYFQRAAYMSYLVAAGIVDGSNTNGNYTGGFTEFIGSDGAIAVQGFASSEPYTLENLVEDWMRPVEYQLVHETGFEIYAQALTVRSEDIEELAPCLELLVPIIQRAQLSYLSAPGETNDLIIEAVETYDTFWQYDQGLAEYSVSTQLELGLVGNGPDDTLGNFDIDRVDGVLDAMRNAEMDVDEDLAAEDLVTNRFIDTSIGLG